MNTKINDLLIGASGIGLTEIVEKSAMLDPNEVTTIGNLLIQIAIGIATLIGLFKRKKPKV